MSLQRYTDTENNIFIHKQAVVLTYAVTQVTHEHGTTIEQHGWTDTAGAARAHSECCHQHSHVLNMVSCSYASQYMYVPCVLCLA